MMVPDSDIEKVEQAVNPDSPHDEKNANAAKNGPYQSENVPKNNNNNSNRRFRRFAIAFAVLAAIGLIVGLSVGLTNRNNDDDDEDDDSADATTPEQQQPSTSTFTRSSSFINNICSPESLNADPNTLAQCEAECTPAECCNPTDSNTCFETDQVSCTNSYVKCHSVLETDGTFMVDPAPLSLEDTCSPENIAVNRTACEEACQPAECCYTNDIESSCRWRIFLCVDYAPCQNLRNGTRVAPAPSNLDEICSPENLASNEEACSSICERSTCCLGDVNPEIDSCVESDFISCLTYVPCVGLVFHVGESAVPPPPDNFNDACSVENLLSGNDGRDDCAEICSVASCCDARDYTKNCFVDDPFRCIEYARCGLLDLTGGIVPRAPKNISNVCRWNVIKDDEDALQECEKLCEPALCCGARDDSNCWDDGNALACAGYAACSLLLLSGGTLEDPPENISDICPWNVTSDPGRKEECQALCDQASCCVAVGDENCLRGNLIACSKWTAGCAPLLRPSSLLPRSSSFINNVCSSESLSTPDGASMCEMECAAFECCDPFQKNGPSCLEEEQVSCLTSYPKCHAVLQKSAVEPAPLNLTDICSPESIASDRSPCEDICERVLCCYSDVDPCPWRVSECVDYASCQNLRNDTSITPAPPNLDEICSQEDDGPCREICEASACCLGDFDPDVESCLESDFISCITYAPCGRLVFRVGNNVVPPPAQDLVEVCSVDNLLSDGDGYENCTELCSPASCCGSDVDNNCFFDDPFGCSEYAPCGLLLLTGGNLTRAPENLNEICRWDRVKDDDEALDECVKACEPASCCGALDETNCLDDGNALACAGYASCSVLWLRDGTLEDPPQNITDVCNPGEVLANEARREECRALCEKSLCCSAEGDENCLVGNFLTCAKWFAGGCWLVS